MKIKKSLILSLLFATALTASGQSFEVNTTQQVRVHLKDVACALSTLTR